MIGPRRLALRWVALRWVAPRWVVGAALSLACAVAFLGLPRLADAQSRLIEARARIDASRAERIHVEIEYLLDVVVGNGEGGGGEPTSVPLEGLAFRPAVVESVTAALEGEPVAISFTVGESERLTAAVSLPSGRVGPTRLLVAYDVTSGFDGDDPYRIRIPLLVVGWASAEALPGVFSLEALLTSDLTVYESFPSGLTRAGEVGQIVRHTLQLPAVPALISMRATTGRAPLGGLVQLLDGLVLVILVATALVGFRFLRGTPTDESRSDGGDSQTEPDQTPGGTG